MPVLRQAFQFSARRQAKPELPAPDATRVTQQEDECPNGNSRRGRKRICSDGQDAIKQNSLGEPGHDSNSVLWISVLCKFVSRAPRPQLISIHAPGQGKREERERAKAARTKLMAEISSLPGIPAKLGDNPLRLLIVGTNPSEHAWYGRRQTSHS